MDEPLIWSVTGHRPNKLGPYPECYQPEMFKDLVALVREWIGENRGSIKEIVTGMALGFDQAVAQACIDEGVPFIAAIPCLEQDSRWQRQSRLYYHELLAKAAEVVQVSTLPYRAYLMQVRNKWMVDHSSKVLALYDGSSSGTGNAVGYALSIDRDVVNIWDRWEKTGWPARLGSGE